MRHPPLDDFCEDGSAEEFCEVTDDESVNRRESKTLSVESSGTPIKLNPTAKIT